MSSRSGRDAPAMTTPGTASESSGVEGQGESEGGDMKQDITNKTRGAKKPSKWDVVADACADECETVVLDKDMQRAVVEADRKLRSADLVDSRPIERTSAGLRDVLFDELEALRNGVSDPVQSKAVAGLAAAILHSVNTELSVFKACEDEVRATNMPATRFVGKD
jgi:hypothetical protein